jgi:hypothetical protein
VVGLDERGVGVLLVVLAEAGDVELAGAEDEGDLDLDELLVGVAGEGIVDGGDEGGSICSGGATNMARSSSRHT